MAVKKTNKEADVKVEVTTEEVVEETVVEEVETTEEPKGLEVDVTPVAEEPKVKGNVRIRMKNDHHCYIGGEHYVLTAGQCYNVPANVKDILNKAGHLAPL